MKEYGDKIPADKKAPIESALNRLREAHKSQDITQIDSALTEMNTAWTAASEDMYKATQDAGGQPGGNGQQNGSTAGAEGSEHVTDAEFEEVK